MKIEELEAQLQAIDDQAASIPIKVTVEGNTEDSGSVSVSVVEQGSAHNKSYAPPAGTAASVPADRDYEMSYRGSAREKMLLDVNLQNVHIPDEYIREKFRAAASKQDRYGELPGVKLSQIGSSDTYQIEEDYTYVTNSFDSTDYALTAVKGFKYDRASVPRIFWVIIDKDSLSNTPPLFHDLLYQNGGVLSVNQVRPYRTFLREEADDLFLELMQKTGVSYLRCQLAYQAVKRFSGFAWKTKITPT